MVGKSRRFKTLTYHRKHGNAKSASVQNSWRLLEKAVLIEKAEKMHTYEDPGIDQSLYCTISQSNFPIEKESPRKPPRKPHITPHLPRKPECRPRKLCESKPGLYKKVIGVFEAAHMAHGSQNAGCGSAAQAVAEESPEYRRSKTRWLNWRVQDG